MLALGSGLLLGALASAAPAASGAPAVEPAALVDPFIGTTGEGNVFPGAVRPWGMASASPHTDPSSPSGFHFNGRDVLGFGQVQISGAGCADLGNVLLTATAGELRTDEAGYRSRRGPDQATPGYYAVDLASYGIRAEMTASLHANFYRFTFPARDHDANLILDVAHALTPSAGAEVRLVSPTEIEGWSRSGDFCGKHQKQTVYFVLRIDQAPEQAGTWRNGKTSEAAMESGDDVGAFLRFSTAAGQRVLVKVGVSYVSISNARRNLAAEIPDWDFERVRREAYQEWNRELGRIEVSGGTEDQRVLFYTGLYHVLIHPSLLSDVNGEYPGMNDAGVRTASGHDEYHLYSLWDTYRDVHPLLALVYPARQRDMAQSLVDKYRESGWLPIWELAGQETNVMVGDPAAIVLADTVVKGITSFDTPLALAAVTKQGTQAPPPGTRSVGRPGILDYLRLGFVPEPAPPGVWGSASTTLEYAAADFASGRLALALGREDEAKAFLDRSLGYRQLYDPSSGGFIRPRSADGRWSSPFDPAANCPTLPCTSAWGSGAPGFVEGSSWQYTFMANHDVPGLIELMGGAASFVGKLQEAFDDGHYRLNNEPDMAYPYLFTFVPGESWRTQRQVRRDLASDFRRQERWLPGNDDTGATSAVYVFGAMGFYPVTPALPEYRLGSPLFDRVVVHLDPKYFPGRTFTVEARNNSAANLYIQSVLLNGRRWTEARLPHQAVVKGGTLALTMGPEPKAWDGAPRAPSIRTQPAPVTVAEGDTAALSVGAEGSALTYQWRRDGSAIPGATTRTLRLSNVTLSQDGVRYDCLVGSLFSTTRVASTSAALSVAPDRTRPVVLSALVDPQRPTRVAVTYSKPMDSATASSASLYRIDSGPTVTAAAFQPPAPGASRPRSVVVLQTAGPVAPGTLLHIDGVRDDAGLKNPLGPTSLLIEVGGDGLTGAYFRGRDFAEQIMERVDPAVDFRYGSGAPDPRVPENDFSVRWTGEVLAPSTGVYAFIVRSDDGARLWIDGRLIVDNWKDQSATAARGTLSLEAGRRYALRLEYYESSGDAVAELSWEPPGQAAEIIPQRCLFSTASTAP